MAYFSDSQPVPQNGLMAPPQRCVDESNAAVEMARCVSVRGRMLAYNTVPSFESLAAVSQGALDSAMALLPQSELARRSVLSGEVRGADSILGPGGVGPSRRPPQVLPLSWAPDAPRSCVTMPAGYAAALADQWAMPSLPDLLQKQNPVPPVVLGISGYNPPWSDASVEGAAAAAASASAAAAAAPTGVMGWVHNNGVLVFGALAIALVIGQVQSGRGRR